MDYINNNINYGEVGNPYYEPLSWFMIPAKIGIKSCRRAGGCISFMYGCSHPAAFLFDQKHVISMGNTGW